HVYARDPAASERARRVCGELPGVGTIERIEHPRAGDFTLVAAPGQWFLYDYWLDPRRAPDYARTVDIHRKPGYDPRELFSGVSAVGVAWKLAKRKLGLRQLLDVVPLDASRVKGTHGRVDLPPERSPVLIVP